MGTGSSSLIAISPLDVRCGNDFELGVAAPHPKRASACHRQATYKATPRCCKWTFAATLVAGRGVSAKGRREGGTKTGGAFSNPRQCGRGFVRYLQLGCLKRTNEGVAHARPPQEPAGQCTPGK